MCTPGGIPWRLPWLTSAPNSASLTPCSSSAVTQMKWRAWITEKIQVTTDESYLDPTNIQSKHQKHQAFEAEVAANAERIQAVMAVGQSKLTAGTTFVFLTWKQIAVYRLVKFLCRVINNYLILPYTDACMLSAFRVAVKKLHRRLGQHSNPWPPAY